MAPHAQMELWVGVKVTGCRRNSVCKTQVQNGCPYKVVEVDAEKVVVQIVIEDDPSDLPRIALTHQEAIQFLRLACCRTYANLQGVTLRDEHLLLLDTQHRHMCRRKLYVAVSRVTEGKYLHISSESQEEDVLRALELRAN